ncbi:MAG: hypothetical protein ACYTF7_00395 [Planctomycetota bacterium]|jgi:hypothetical protein
MRRTIIGTCSAITCIGMCVVVGAQQTDTLPPEHPPVERREPLDASQGIPAREGDVDSLESIVGAYYESISANAGEPRDWDRLRSLFVPNARLLAARSLPEGGAAVWPLTVEDYIDANRTYFERGGYHEREVSRQVEQFGNIAQVWSTYEARRHENELEPYARGIYSIHLLKGGTRWWIVGMYWDYERPDTPIPDKYLAGDQEETE